DVGVDDGGDAGVLEGKRQIERARLRDFGPALDGDATAPRIDADDDALRPRAARLLHERGRAQGDRAENDARNTLLEPALDHREIADAAAELNGDGCHRRDDRLDGRSVHRLSRERTV